MLLRTHRGAGGSWRILARRVLSAAAPAPLLRPSSRPLAVAPATEHTLGLAAGLLRGERVALSRAITLVESSNPEHGIQAEHLLENVLRNREKKARAFRLGITGPPGAGKSTFIEALGTMLVRDVGLKVAVIAVDPSSTKTHGSILGDKTRMVNLSVEERAYVRASPTRGHLGGIAQHTNDVVLLTEAAGYDVCIVETVGLGQSEIQVDDAVDMLVLLVPPANGDELQGVKRGVMEVADLVVVNKADGPLEELARHAAVDYMHALQLMRRKRKDWRPRVRRCSAATGMAVKEVWDTIDKFRREMEACGELERKRADQARLWMWAEFSGLIVDMAARDAATLAKGAEMESHLAQAALTPRHAARRLLQTFLGGRD
jgi:LAO/AO transport system kinase